MQRATTASPGGRAVARGLAVVVLASVVGIGPSQAVESPPTSSLDGTSAAPDLDDTTGRGQPAGGGSTSPTTPSPSAPATEGLGVPPGAITFSEFPLGTAITTQYRSRGIVFSGDSPFITTDSSNPTSPVLSGTPLFAGEIRGTFVDPVSGAARTVGGFSLDVGYINTPGSVKVIVYGRSGSRIGQLSADGVGIVRIDSTFAGAASFLVKALSSEPAGFAIDNVVVGPGVSSGVPRGLSARSDSGGRIQLVWRAPDDASGVTGYRILRNGTPILDVGPATFAAGDDGAPSGPPVSYQVQALTALGPAGVSAAKTAIRVSGTRPSYARVGPLKDWRRVVSPNEQALLGATWVPDLDTGFTPQGVTLVPAGVRWPSATLLVSGYTHPAGRCYVYAINTSTGRVRNWYRFPAGQCSHAGGIEFTASRNSVWVSDTHRLFELNLAKMFDPARVATAIRTNSSLLSTSQNASAGLNGSFVFDQPAGPGCPAAGGCLWIGHWRRGRTTLLYQYSEAYLRNRAVTGTNGSIDRLEVAEDGQGAAWGYNGTILLTASTSQCGLLHVVDADTGATVPGGTYQFSPGTEQLALDGAGGLYNVSEAGSRQFHTPSKPAFFPVIAHWDASALTSGGSC